MKSKYFDTHFSIMNSFAIEFAIQTMKVDLSTFPTEDTWELSSTPTKKARLKFGCLNLFILKNLDKKYPHLICRSCSWLFLLCDLLVFWHCWWRGWRRRTIVKYFDRSEDSLPTEIWYSEKQQYYYVIAKILVWALSWIIIFISNNFNSSSFYTHKGHINRPTGSPTSREKMCSWKYW